MKRSEQARMTIGLSIPGNGPVARPAGARPALARFKRRRRPYAKGMLAGVRRWSREHGLDTDHAAYWSMLLVCCSLFGLVVGGYVGFIETATPAADAPGSFTQLAASDVGWAAKMSQNWLAAHPAESAEPGQRVRETHLQRLIRAGR